MRKLFLVVMAAGLLLAALSTAALADIYGPWDYWARYTRVEGVPTWGLQPGSVGYGLPSWGYDSNWYWWHIPNLYCPGKVKLVYWEVEWMTGITPPVTPPDLHLNPEMGTVTPITPVYNPNNLSWTWRWGITIQPGWEQIRWDYHLYPGYYSWFYNLNNIYLIDVATWCIPEPSSLAALAFGAFGAGVFAWRRRR